MITMIPTETCCICGKREAQPNCQYCADCYKHFVEKGVMDPRD